MAKPPNSQKYIDSKGLAKRHSVDEPTIRRQRHEDRGPPYVRFGGRIFYEIKAVEKWEAEQLTAPIVPGQIQAKKRKK